MQVGKIVKGYTFVKWLGRGSFGEVWSVSKGGMQFAIKITYDTDISAKTEIDFANNIRLTCPFLVNFISTFREDESFPGRLFIVMDLCSHGNLLASIEDMKTKKNKIPIERLMKIFIQLVLAFFELHSNGILHRDMKAENVPLDEKDDVKLGDFGLSRVMDSVSQKASTVLGTLEYMSPEILSNKPYDGKSDMWALGVLIYQMCMLKLPFLHPVRAMIPMVILQGNFERFPQNSYDDRVCQLFYSLLTQDPDLRPSARDVLLNPIVVSYATQLDLLKYYHSDVRGAIGFHSPTQPAPLASPTPASAHAGAPAAAPAPTPVRKCAVCNTALIGECPQCSRGHPVCCTCLNALVRVAVRQKTNAGAGAGTGVETETVLCGADGCRDGVFSRATIVKYSPKQLSDELYAPTTIELVMNFRSNPRGGFSFTSTALGQKCTFLTEGFRTVFLDKAIGNCEGIFHWSTKMNYRRGPLEFGIGAAPTSRLYKLDTELLGRAGGCSLYFFTEDTLWVELCGVSDCKAISLLPPGSDYDYDCAQIPDGSLVDVEVDSTAHTLCFFVNGKRIDYGISGLQFPLNLGVSGYGNNMQSFTSISFRRLPTSTPATITSSFFMAKSF